MSWSREELKAALPDTTAGDECRQALDHGARFLSPSSKLVPASQIFEIYRSRHRRLVQKGVAILGWDDALAGLRAHSGDVRTASVHTKQWNFVIFLDAGQPRALSCFAVDSAVANQNWDHSDWQL